MHVCVRIQAINPFTCVCSQMRMDGLPKPAPEAHLEQGGSENTHSHSRSAAIVSERHHHHHAACDRPTKVRNGVCLLRGRPLTSSIRSMMVSPFCCGFCLPMAHSCFTQSDRHTACSACLCPAEHAPLWLLAEGGRSLTHPGRPDTIAHCWEHGRDGGSNPDRVLGSC